MTAKMIFGAMLVLAGFARGAYAEDELPIVKQGGVAVTLADVQGFLQQQMPEDKWQGFLNNPERVNQMLIGILRDKQLANQAIAMKLDQDPKVLDQIAYSRNLILSSKRMGAFDASLKIPSMEQAAKEQYLAHKADYVVPEVVDVQHVLITQKGRTEDDAKALAEKVHSEAVANPAAFDELVMKYSEDPMKAEGKGRIPDATSGRFVPEFAAAAKKLTAVGEISPLVKTPYGYHVLKLTRKVPAKPQDFAAVKDQLIAKLKQDYIADQRRAFLIKLDESAATVNQEGIEALQKRYSIGTMEDIGEAIKAAQAAESKKK